MLPKCFWHTFRAFLGSFSFTHWFIPSKKTAVVSFWPTGLMFSNRQEMALGTSTKFINILLMVEEIRRENQLRDRSKKSTIIYNGFVWNKSQVVGNGISEPSTVSKKNLGLVPFPVVAFFEGLFLEIPYEKVSTPMLVVTGKGDNPKDKTIFSKWNPMALPPMERFFFLNLLL